MFRFLPVWLWLVILVLASTIYVVCLPANSLVGWFHSDDAFYYFKVAQNVAEGQGFTFDGSGRASGFHPLWMIILIPVFTLAQIDLLFPLRVVVILSAILSAGTSVLIYKIMREGFGPREWLAPIPFIVALFWAFYPKIHQSVVEMGLESGVSAFFITLLLYRVIRHHSDPQRVPVPGSALNILISGLVGNLAVLARLDNIFLVGILGIWLTLRSAWARYLLVSDIVLVIFGVLYSYLLRVGFGPQFAAFSPSVYAMVVVALVTRIGLYALTGLYERPLTVIARSGWIWGRMIWVPLLSSLIIAGLMLAALYLGAFPGGFPRSVLLVEAVIGLASVVTTRLIASLPHLRRSEEIKKIPWQKAINRLLIYSFPVGLTLLIYMGLSQAYFHTYIPVSGQIKRWWGTLPNTVYGEPVHNLTGMLGFEMGSQGPWTLVTDVLKPTQTAGWIILLIVSVVTIILLILNMRRTIVIIDRLAIFPLLAGGMVQLISYTGTGYLHMRDWYWTCHLLVITLSLGVIVDSITSYLISLSGASNLFLRRFLYGIFIFGGGLIFIAYQVDLSHRFPIILSPRMSNYYLEPIRELEENTEPGAVIGSTGGGVIAYFVRNRTIINLDGLMNTAEYFDMLKKGDACNYLDQLGLQYVYAKELVITDSDPYFQFKDRLTKIKNFGGSTLFYWSDPGKSTIK